MLHSLSQDVGSTAAGPGGCFGRLYFSPLPGGQRNSAASGLQALVNLHVDCSWFDSLAGLCDTELHAEVYIYNASYRSVAYSPTKFT